MRPNKESNSASNLYMIYRYNEANPRYRVSDCESLREYNLNNNKISSRIQVGSRKGKVYPTLSLPHRGRKVVSEDEIGYRDSKQSCFFEYEEKHGFDQTQYF